MLNKINHTQLSNDFIDEYMNKLSGSETKVFIAISRKTIGWHKETDKISISQIMEITGLSNRCVIDSLKKLEAFGLIKIERRKDTKMMNHINEYTINYEESSLSKVKKVHKGCEKNGNMGCEKSSHTKETITKETKQKKEKPPTFQQIKEYAVSKKMLVDVNEFYEYYTESNWHDIHGNKVKNWKLKLLTWNNREKKKTQYKTVQDISKLV